MERKLSKSSRFASIVHWFVVKFKAVIFVSSEMFSRLKKALWLTLTRHRLIALRFPKAIGECLVMTHFLHDLKRAYPQLNVIVYTHFPELLINNPDVYEARAITKLSVIFTPFLTLFYGFKHDRPHSFWLLEWFGVKPPYSAFRPYLYLSDEEISQESEHLPQRFIVFNPHGNAVIKRDKRAPSLEWYVELVSLMNDVTFVQVGLANEELLQGAIDKRGLSLRRSAAVCALSVCGMFHDGGTMHLASTVADLKSVVAIDHRNLGIHSYFYPHNINLIDPPERRLTPAEVAVTLRSLYDDEIIRRKELRK
jgi:hypothetical protein